MGLPSPVNGQLGDGQGVGRITNDTPVPTLTILDVGGPEGNPYEPGVPTGSRHRAARRWR